MTSDLELFNTMLFNQPNVQNSVINPEYEINRIKGKDLKYPIPLDKIPKSFDPRHPAGVPVEDVDKWFYKNYDGQLIPIDGWPMDQAGCGSCWGFAASTVFSAAARLRMNQMYPDKACLYSPIFNLVFTCVGDARIVNGKPAKLYAIQTRNGFSPYYVIAFSPKQTVNSEGQIVTERICESAVQQWQDSFALRKGAPDIATQFGAQFALCQGCRGNSLEPPLMLITNSGVPFLSDYTLHEWACFFGTPQDRQAFCSNEYIAGDITYNEPKLYHADKFSHVTTDDLKSGNMPSGITNMTDWMMSSIYNYGPCSVGYRIYGSFLQFFKNPGNRNNIYTADVFLNDIANDTGVQFLAGHSVSVSGWGEVVSSPNPNTDLNAPNTRPYRQQTRQNPSTTTTGQDTGSQPKIIKFWIVKNTWGEDWGDGGYFRIERDIDEKLARAEVEQRIQFGSEFGALYFNPAPTSEMTIGDMVKLMNEGKLTAGPKIEPVNKHPLTITENKSPNEYNINDMTSFFQAHPNNRCLALGQFPEIIDKMTNDCSCRCGDSYNPATRQCERYYRTAGAGTKSSTVPLSQSVQDSASKEKIHSCKEKGGKILLLLLLLLLLFATLLFAFNFFKPVEKFCNKEKKYRKWEYYTTNSLDPKNYYAPTFLLERNYH